VQIGHDPRNDRSRSPEYAGAADDLAKVTDIARQIVTRFGMSPEVGQAVFEPQQSRFLGEQVLAVRERDFSDRTAEKIDDAVRTLIDEAYERARQILATRREELTAGAELLLHNETITPEEFPALLGQGLKQG
jgi:cell division protease FtsH